MKAGIIGDTHFGASFSLGKKNAKTGLNTRLEDYEKTACQTINRMTKDGVKHLIFTGDIFEHRHPNTLYQKIFSRILSYAFDCGVECIDIVVGNHDQQRTGDATTISYLKELNLPTLRVHEELDLVTISDKNDVPVANWIFMPYRDRSWLEADDHVEAVKIIQNDLKYLMSQTSNQAPIFLVGHMTIEGTFYADEDLILYSDKEVYLPQEMFEGIDITIMGHVHSPYVISESPYIAYIGSMEKRGAFEDHDKKYAIIDPKSVSVEYFAEPCREIYELKVDYSESFVGETLMDRFYEDLEEFASFYNLKNSIVKVIVKITSYDEQFCDVDAVKNILYEKYSVFNCVSIKPILTFSRQARDKEITENSSDTDSFIRYIKNTIEDEDYRSKLISAGLEYIVDGEGES